MFEHARLPYTVALEVGGWEVIKQYVAMGMGISIITSICLTDADRDRLAARSLSQWFPTRSYGVVVRKGKYLSPQARAFIELIQPDLFARRGYDELEVFREIGQGQSTRQIAVKLCLSVKTVETHITHIKRKLGLRSGTELQHRAILWSNGKP